MAQSKPGIIPTKAGKSSGGGSDFSKALFTSAGFGLVGVSLLIVAMVVLDIFVFRSPDDSANPAKNPIVKPPAQPDTSAPTAGGPILRDGPLTDEAREYFRYTAYNPTGPDERESGMVARPDREAANLFEIADVTTSAPIVHIPRSAGGSGTGATPDERFPFENQQAGQGASAAVKITGTIRNLSGRDCRRLSLKAYCFDVYGQIVGQGGTTITDDPDPKTQFVGLRAGDTRATPFAFDVSGMAKDVQIDKVEIVPDNVYWALDE